VEATCNCSLDNAGDVALLDKRFGIHRVITVHEAQAADDFQFELERAKRQLGKAGNAGKSWCAELDILEFLVMFSRFKHLHFRPATELRERGGRAKSDGQAR
jgi:hypothetical protein